MSIMKDSHAYSNSLTAIRQSFLKSHPNAQLEREKNKKKGVFPSFICCFCIPSSKAIKHSMRLDSNEIKPNSSCQLNGTTFLQENSKMEENYNINPSISNLKSKSHFAFNEIMTPALPKPKKHRILTLKESCVMKRTKSEENFSKLIVSSFPKNTLFFLKINENNFVFARNIHLNFKISLHYEKKKMLAESFSFKKKIIKIDSDSFSFTEPEVVCKHLAKKLNGINFLLEYGCGVGNLTTKFAKKCSIVCAMDMHLNKLNYAEYNSRVFGLEDKILFIQKENLKNLKVKPDLIFLNPEWELINMFPMESSLISFQNLSPNILSLLEDSLKICPNIVIVLPKCVNINEFSAFFSYLEEKNLMHDKRYSIEFEYVHLNNKLWKIYAFIGNLNTINLQDEIEFLSTNLNEDIDCDVLYRENTELLKQIEKNIGIRNILKILPELLLKEQLQNKNLTHFQKFLDILKSKNLISNNEISDLLSTFHQKNKKTFIKKESNLINKSSLLLSIKKNSFNLKKTEDKYNNNPIEIENEIYQSEYSEPSFISGEDKSENTNVCHTNNSFAKRYYKSFKDKSKESPQRKKVNISFG